MKSLSKHQQYCKNKSSRLKEAFGKREIQPEVCNGLNTLHRSDFFCRMSQLQIQLLRPDHLHCPLPKY